ncbi:MAG: YraN family protein [Candidatus Peribacteraceae bacterium]
MTHAHILGATGEKIAAQYLRDAQYEVLGCNVRLSHDEIDIIARDTTRDMIVFVEVKTRTSVDPAYPVRSSLTKRKRAAMRRAMYRWMQEQGHEGCARLDLLVVTGGRVFEHFYDLGSEFII